MAEQQNIVKVYQIDYYCDNCVNSKLIYAYKYDFMTDTYSHICDKCLNLVWLKFPYPRTVYENCE